MLVAVVAAGFDCLSGLSGAEQVSFSIGRLEHSSSMATACEMFYQFL